MKSETVNFLRQSWRFITPYWRSEEKYKAFGLLAAVMILTLANIAISVKLAYWTQAFYDALEKRDYHLFLHQIAVFFGLILVFIPIAVSNIALNSVLNFRWRQWMTSRFLDRWVHKDMYYRVLVDNKDLDNPDQRISQDLDFFSSLSLGLFLSFFQEIVTLLSFAVVLWNISSDFPLQILGSSFKVPGYLLWVAFIYAAIGTGIIIKVGKPLIDLNFVQQHYEANFRYSLIRLQEKKEEIAIFGGVKPEMKTLTDAFSFIRQNYYAIVVRNIYIKLCYVPFINMSQLIPVVAAAPLYFSGVIMLGTVMQVARSFEQVRDSFSVIATNFSTIASWRASALRLLQFDHCLKNSEQNLLHYNIDIAHKGHNIEVKNLELHKPNNAGILKGLNFSIKERERVALVGSSGVGKSTIIRALRGIWMYGEGKINIPNNVFFVPQRPYMPLSTLREAIVYPQLLSEHGVENKELIELMQLFRLKHLISDLDEVKNWSGALSLGEQQRISFIRILINKPKYIVMDEPTSSLNTKLEALVFKTLLERLKDSTVVTITHSETLKKYHQRSIDVEKWSVDPELV